VHVALRGEQLRVPSQLPHCLKVGAPSLHVLRLHGSKRSQRALVTIQQSADDVGVAHLFHCRSGTWRLPGCRLNSAPSSASQRAVGLMPKRDDAAGSRRAERYVVGKPAALRASRTLPTYDPPMNHR
jgi:hypothetical protein